MGTAYQEQAKVFKALCDPKRLAILEQLRSGEKCACVLQEPLDLTQSGLSYHMKILCDSGIVVSRQEGKWMHYRLSPAGRNYGVMTTPALVVDDKVVSYGKVLKKDEAKALIQKVRG